MSKLFAIKPEHVEEWKGRLSEEDFQKLCGRPFDIDVIVDLAKEWDIALQRMLDEVQVVSDNA